AKLLLISGYTESARRGRFALQESNDHALAAGLYSSRGLFDYAVSLATAAELPQVMRTLIRGFASPGGFIAHLAIPLSVQASDGPEQLPMTIPAVEVGASAATMAEVRERLRKPFAIWAGWGARHASPRLLELVERTGARVIATPRGKGCFPEDHPRYLGVSGMVGGHEDLAERLAAADVETMLVLGTRLGEFSSGFDDRLIPRGGMIHVDLDPRVPGAAFPHVETLLIQAEVDGFLRDLLARFEADPPAEPLPPPIPAPRPLPRLLRPRPEDRVRPQYLMQCLQSRVVDGSHSVLMAESGNSFTWTTNLLRFNQPNRYRQSGLFCPMGHVSAGALGVAAASGRRAVAVVGDGAMLMQNEVSTAARTGAHVTWIVLNDARYGMVDQGLSALGYPAADMLFPEVDFLAMARSLGADGARVYRETQLLEALEWAMEARGPFILDVLIDPRERAPFGGRVRSIDTQTQGVSQ
ncbi:MAG: thiamine pyrophosphate-binding protein, partial [Myxococcales bacterium]|nr:thiamine pyrophosphate-binding protein [Myxococcales bacterium]